MANVGTLTLVQGVPPVLNPAQRTNTFVKDRPSKFGRVHVTTSASSLIAVLATRSFVGVDNPNLAQPEPIVVIPESKLRALLMKALGWFIDREYTNLDGAVVVFVGKKMEGNAPTTGLALPLAAVHKLADEFGTGGRDREFDLDCDASGTHPFHVGSFCVEHSHWAVPIAGVFGIAGLCALVLLYAFLRDVATLLMFLPPTL